MSEITHEPADGRHAAELAAGNSMRHYIAESARPLVSMAFIAPLLAIYELGVILLGPHSLPRLLSLKKIFFTVYI